MPIKGVKLTKRGMKAAMDRITGPVTEGAVYAVLSQGAAMAQTLTPIDTGNLINSQYAPQISRGEGKVEGHVGYTAAYAKAVHDAPGKLSGQPRDPADPSRGDFWDPNAEPKFLTQGFEDIKLAIPQILKANYRV